MAYLFNGSTQYLSVAHDAALSITGGITIAMWVRPTSTTANKTMLCKTDTTAARITYELDQGTNLRPRFAFATAAGSFHIFSAAILNNLTQSAWNHLALTYTFGTGASAVMYRNGSPLTASWTAGNGNDVPATSANPLFIGAYQDFSTGVINHFAGDVAETGVWNAQLTAAEIASLGKGFSPLMVRPQSLVLATPLIRNLQDLKGARAITAVNSPSASTHPRVIYPGGAQTP